MHWQRVSGPQILFMQESWGVILSLTWWLGEYGLRVVEIVG